MKSIGIYVLGLLIGMPLLVNGQTNTPWTTNGRIGIGTTSTHNATLTVRESTTSQIRLENDALGEEAGIRWRTRSSSGSYIHADLSLFYPSSGLAYIGFKIPHNNTPGGGYQMVVNSNGHVGIGTSSPTARLHVTNGDLLLQNQSGTGYPALRLKNVSGTNTLKIDYNSIVGEGDNFIVRSGTTNSIILNDNGGNVGIGTATPRKLLTLSSLAPAIDLYDSDGAVDAKSWQWGTTANTLHFSVRNDANTAGSDYFTIHRTGNSIDKTILPNGDVGIGTSSPDAKLTVKGDIHAEQVRVDLSIPAPDYVFADGYHLRSLEETEKYIKANHHLPEVPSAKDLEARGVDLVEMNMLLLKKVEELTLHMIELKKENESQQKEISKLKKNN